MFGWEYGKGCEAPRRVARGRYSRLGWLDSLCLSQLVQEAGVGGGS
jgi:hypothetical protein